LELIPSEFLAMSPKEFWRLYYAKVDRNKREAGRLADGDIDDLLAMLKDHKSNE
jgi:hypothetical protein